MKKRDDIASVTTSSVQLKSWLEDICPAAGIEVVGAVSLPCQLPHRQQWEQWIESGRHGGLEYLIREPENRVDPTLRNPWARSILVMAHRYTAGLLAMRPRLQVGGLPWKAPGLNESAVMHAEAITIRYY